MQKRIDEPEKDPLGCMLLDFLNGDKDAFVSVASETLDMWKMPGKTLFRSFGGMNRIERKALSLCKGTILDIGAGAGSHSLYLKNKGYLVTALDQSCGCVTVMEQRGLENVLHENLFLLESRPFDTLLMLMNGIGLVGSLDGLNLFFQFIGSLMAPAGQILLDSTDLAVLYDRHTLNRILELSGFDYYGQAEFIMTYKEISSDRFDWLYIDFKTLSAFAGLHGFECKQIIQDKTGKYLALIKRKK